MLTRRSTAPLDAWGLAALARGLEGVPIRLVLWNGLSRLACPGIPLADIVIHDRATLWRLLRNPDLAFGEGYTDGRVTVDGDLVGWMTRLAGRFEVQRVPRLRLLLRARGGGRAGRAARNARHHYDLGNDFYRLWLDDGMVYTCAYFESADQSLEDAQRAKHEYVARKLALRPGERVFEAGSGWGALAIHLAREHHVSVRAWNVSHEQVRWATDRARALGLEHQVEFVEGDYRTMSGTCDAFVSVGMLEHVGASHYTELGQVMDRTLDPRHGRGLLHFIGRNRPEPMGHWISRHIFPGAYVPSLREVLERVTEPAGFSVLDVENLRPHYALTLGHWLERFDAAAPEVTARFGERFTRMWRLYLAEAQAGFRGGSLQLFQVLFSRAGCRSLPLTRAALHQPDAAPGRPS